MNKKRIVILHQEVHEDGPPDEVDVLNAAESIRQVLETEEFEPVTLAADPGFRFIPVLKAMNPFLAFNLVETFGGSADAAAMIPTILKFLKIPFTGSSHRTLFLTTDKILTKNILSEAGLPTPSLFKRQDSDHFIPGWYIFKPVREDASIGISDDSVRDVRSYSQAQQILESFEKAESIPFFGEHFVPGREFNVSVIEHGGTAQILFPAEMIFTGDVNPFKIVDYESKWVESSPRYRQSNRTFTYSESDQVLLNRLRELTEQCWHLTGLQGYARVDFRVDEDNQPWILEVNANPCISPDGGLAAAALYEGLSYQELILRIIQEAIHDDQKRDPSL